MLEIFAAWIGLIVILSIICYLYEHYRVGRRAIREIIKTVDIVKENNISFEDTEDKEEDKISRFELMEI